MEGRLRPHRDSGLRTHRAAPRQSYRVERAGLPARGPNLTACSMWGGQGLSRIRPLSPQPLDRPHPHPAKGRPLTALLLVTLVEAVGQPITLPGPGDAPPVAAHEVARNVALVGEVVPGEQLALCRREETGDQMGREGTELRPHHGTEPCSKGVSYVRLPVGSLTNC